MSWFLTEGQKLERKEKWKEAAEWYEKQGQSDDALRCWEKHFYNSPRDYALCLERHKKYLKAAKYYLYADSSHGFRNCYAAVGKYEEGAHILFNESDYWSKNRKEYYVEEAVNLLIDGKLYEKAIDILTITPIGIGQDKMLNIFKIVSKELPPDKFKEFIIKYWDKFVRECIRSNSISLPFDTDVLGIITIFYGDPIILHMMIDALVFFILVTEYCLPDNRRQRVFPLGTYSEWLRNSYPQLAIDYCLICLKAKHYPLLPEDCKDWKDSEIVSIWLSELSKAYFANNEMEKAIEVYSSRYRFGEAAEVLEELGRIDEAIALLEQSGAANYRTRDTSWDKQLIDPLVRERFWREKIAQLKGRVAATKHLKKAEEKPQKPSLDDLDKMFALGEITAEEYKKMKSHSEDGKAQEENQNSNKRD